MASPIHKWLSDPRRSYAVGLELFMTYASAAVRERHTVYLSRKPYPTSSSDHRMQLLIDKLRRLSGSQRIPVARSVVNVARPSAPVHHPSPAKTETTAETSRRLKVVTYNNLPDEQKAYYDRIKSLVPVRTQLKAELNTAKTDPDRKAVALRILDVDDELRSLWDKLDNWAAGKKTIQVDVERPTYSDNTFVAAMQVAHRRKQLGDNIRSAKMSIARYTKEGRQDLLERAQRRLERYERERDNLEKNIADAEQGH